MTTKKTKYVRKEWDIGVNSCCWEYKLVQAIWESVGRLLNNLKIALRYYPSIPYLVNAPRNTIQHATQILAYLSQELIMESTVQLINRWIVKENMACIHILYVCLPFYDVYFYYKNKLRICQKILTIVIIVFNQIIRTFKDQHHTYSF